MGEPEKKGLCGADCGACPNGSACCGCAATGGSPFGGRCTAEAYFRVGGRAADDAYKATLLAEVNALLSSLDLPLAEALYELPGAQINLSYPLPNGKCVPFLRDEDIYLGTQIAFADLGVCYGVVADCSFLLICSYGRDGSMPEVVLYKRR